MSLQVKDMGIAGWFSIAEDGVGARSRILLSREINYGQIIALQMTVRIWPSVKKIPIFISD